LKGYVYFIAYDANGIGGIHISPQLGSAGHNSSNNNKPELVERKPLEQPQPLVADKLWVVEQPLVAGRLWLVLAGSQYDQLYELRQPQLKSYLLLPILCLQPKQFDPTKTMPKEHQRLIVSSYIFIVTLSLAF
jgi:hypothetical protein